MPYSRTFEATSPGAAELELYGYNSDIEVVADSGCQRAYVEVYTEASSGPSVKTIDELPESRGRVLSVRLPQDAGMTVVGGGSVSISGSGGIIMTGGGGMQINSFGRGGGESDMYVNGRHIKIKGNRTWIDGVEVTEAAGGNMADSDRSDPPMEIHIRAVVPYGSHLEAETYNGDISSENVGQVKLKSYNGDIRAAGLAQDSRLKSYNGTLTVGAEGGLRPAVEAETYNGDIRALDDDVKLRPKTYNGNVRYPR